MGWVVSFTPRPLYPQGRTPSTYWIGSWVGPRAVRDAAVKRKIPSLRRESNPRTPTVQSVVQSYTDWAITALHRFTDISYISKFNSCDAFTFLNTLTQFHLHPAFVSEVHIAKIGNRNDQIGVKRKRKRKDLLSLSILHNPTRTFDSTSVSPDFVHSHV
jgi:hypothetical protein